MAQTRKHYFTPGMAVRMFADAAILQFALVSALAMRLFVWVAFQDNSGGVDVGDMFRNYLSVYCNTAWPLTGICLGTFYLAGFYTYGRHYQGRYKVLVVSQAISLAFLLYGFLAFFFSASIIIPRVALVLAWLFSLLLLISARVWTSIWERIVRPESERRRRGVNIADRHVLVIGGAGYIGSALLPKLLERGYHVRLLDALMFGESPIAAVADHPNLDLIPGDFRHVENVVGAVRDVDAVIHLGAIVGDPACNLDEDLTIDVNLSATRMIAELAKSSGVERFIFASTCSVYGACDEMLDEHSLVKPVSLYGHTKLASEQVLLGMADDRFTPSIVRFATIYGLSGRTRFDLVVNLLTAKAKIDGEITVFGGDQWRPFVHVDDAAAAVAVILESPMPLIANQIFNVGSNDQNYTISEIGEMVHQRVVGSTITSSGNDGDVRNYRVDFSKIRNLLGFKPTWTIDQGIDQVLHAIATGEVTDYREVRYSNVAFLNQEGTSSMARDNWARELIRDLAGNDVTSN